MLTIKMFNDKSQYISPIDEIKIYHETNKLMIIWKDIILKNSDKRITQLTSGHQNILFNIIPYLNINFKKDKIIGPQLDRLVVNIILWSSSKVFKNKKVIDEIYLKTKNAVSQYFHHDILVKAYVCINEMDRAIEIVKQMYEKNHIAYYYAILKYDVSKFNDSVFKSELLKIKRECIIELLSMNEKVDLTGVSYFELLDIINSVESRKKEKLS